MIAVELLKLEGVEKLMAMHAVSETERISFIRITNLFEEAFISVRGFQRAAGGIRTQQVYLNYFVSTNLHSVFFVVHPT